MMVMEAGFRDAWPGERSWCDDTALSFSDTLSSAISLAREGFRWSSSTSRRYRRPRRHPCPLPLA
ncbi:hypothetical protein BQ8482_130114 [Mesorhizobium delmotii]|uniref:Uncharacterized protein n=1 Tax=Mesorhizobium delmotii TaxID=1631247 RepID=A0A2P9AGF4_9HYPH|nr:hypothetical protein BQ8482_130114 [Mesorhizobium delmotii]